MNKDIKKILLCAGTLCLISGISATLIGVVNMFASNVISSNNEKKEKEALKEVFPLENIGKGVEVNDDLYIKKYWTVSGENEGRAYKCEGKNGYGSISLLIGIYSDFSLGRLSITNLEQSYGQTLKDNYISIYGEASNGSERETALENVNCGATYGATLIKNMVKQAQNHYKEGK